MEMKREDAVDVLFIAMPFCDEYMPCLTLALFKSVLARAGIKSRVQHEYLYYASRIGLEKYRSIMQVCTIGYGHDYFACETIFGKAAHGKTISSFEDYIRWMQGKHLPGKVFAGRQREDTLHSLDLFQEAHAMAEAYLTEACARVMEQHPKIVAFISMFQQHNAMIALARRLKKEKDAPLILAGGANCEGDAGAALAEYVEAFDYVFTGEADEIIAPLCSRASSRRSVTHQEDNGSGANHARSGQIATAGFQRLLPGKGRPYTSAERALYRYGGRFPGLLVGGPAPLSLLRAERKHRSSVPGEKHGPVCG